MLHTDTAAPACPACQSTRCTYTMPNRGAAYAHRRCLGCKRAVSIPAAADVARKVSPSLDASRVWFANFY
jgi:hypothetical protein